MPSKKSSSSKFSVTALKKQLSQKNKEELIQEIANLCKIFPQVKEYYEGQSGDILALSQKYKDIIKKEFLSSGKSLPRARYGVARKALNDFKKLTKEPSLIADMMMTYVESMSNFNNEFGPDGESFYTRPEDLFENTLSFIKANNLLEEFKERAYQVVLKATEGWGHQDSLEERFSEVYGRFKR